MTRSAATTTRKKTIPSVAATRFVAHSSCGSIEWYWLKLRIAPPSPSCRPEGSSPMIAPTTLAVAAILSAVNTYGSEVGTRSFQSTVERPAA